MVDGHRDGALPNMLPDERIVYKTSASRAGDVLGILPATFVIVTNKRFVLSSNGVFTARRRSVYYDKIGSMELRKGVIGSTLLINALDEGKNIPAGSVTFRTAAQALSVFGVVSSMMHAAADPNYDTAMKHKLLHENNLAGRNTAYIPTADGGISAFARNDTKNRRKAAQQGTVVSTAQREVEVLAGIKNTSAVVQMVAGAEAARPEKPIEALNGLNSNAMIKGSAGSAYYSNGIFAPHDAKIKVQGFYPAPTLEERFSSLEVSPDGRLHRAKAGSMRPEDMKIFRIRKMRAAHAATQERWIDRWNPFNIFNTE